MDFLKIPDAPRFTLKNARMPACLHGVEGGLRPVDLTIENGSLIDGPEGEPVDLGGRIVLPAFTDMHTHLDKGHIWPRSPNPDGTFMGALTTVTADREARWAAEDVRRRMEFSLRCAYAHGTWAMRTHLDSRPPQHDISWSVFDEVRADWAGRIELQAACLAPIDAVSREEFTPVADRVAASGGVLGAVTYPVADLDARLDLFFRMASERGLSADFHVDETGDASSATLRAIAQAVSRNRFTGTVVVGHCCSLAVQDADEVAHTLDLVAETQLKVVSLPMCNMYLQDRVAGRTPRWRGVTLVHEMKAVGIDVAFASDNTRDPFYAYGDMDMLEVMREATRIAHLDHSAEDWPLAFTKMPSDMCGFPPCAISDGACDAVIFNARDWTELFARPQSDRIVLRAGRPIDRTPPDYAELDDLMETT